MKIVKDAVKSVINLDKALDELNKTSDVRHIERAGKPNIVLDKFSEIEDFIIKIEETLNHNLKLGYIKEETTVVELLEFFKEMKNNYLPFQREIVKFIEANQNK